MGLPKLQHPTFELTIPSTKQTIRYRPFLVKEEKILLLAQESKNIADMIVAVKQIINNCIIEGKVDLDIAPSFDVEYMFLMLRANSISDVAKLRITDPETEKMIPIEVNLKEVQVKETEGHNKTIKINDDVTLEMRYPNYKDIQKMQESNAESQFESTFGMIRACADKVYNGEEEVHALRDYTDEEVNEFIDSFNTQNYQDVQNFFDTMQRLEHTVDYKVGKKMKQHTFVGMQSFFS